MSYIRAVLQLLLFIVFSYTLTPFVFAEEKAIIHFGIIPRYNPMIMYQNYQPIMDYLTQTTPYRFELKLASSYPKL